MRSGAENLQDITKGVMIAIMLVFSAFLILVGLASRWMAEIGLHLFGGFVFFLKENFSTLTSNPDIWIPGLVAFLLSTLLIHYLGRSWLKKKDEAWRVSNSVCLGLIIPTLFIIAFIIPGTFLQIRMIGKTPLTERKGGSARSAAIMHARNAAQAALGYANIKDQPQLPATLAEAYDEFDLSYSGLIPPSESRDHLREPIIYLAGGLGLESNPSLPLTISPIYMHQGKKMRTMFTIEGERIEFEDSELDEWIEKSLEARRQLKAGKPSQKLPQNAD